MKSTPAGAIGTLLVLLMLSSCAAPAQLSSTQPLTAAPVPSPAVTATYAPEPPPLPSPTITVTSSATHTPTDVSTFSPTATPSSTPRSTATPTATPSIPRVVILKTANIRGGPGTNYAVVASGKVGDEYDVCGRNQAADWVQLCGYGDPQRWIYVGVDLKLAEIAGAGVIGDIPGVPPPPTPTPRPATATPDSARLAQYLDKISPSLTGPILATTMRDQRISDQEVQLVRNLATYSPASQTQIVERGLVDELYGKRDPERILHDLSSPLIVVYYLDNHFTYEAQYPVVYKPALEAIQLGKGGCIRYAQIGAEALLRSGYTSDAWNMVVNITSPLGHNVTLFKEPNSGGELPSPGQYYVITNGQGVPGRLGNGAVLLGPYPTAYQAAVDIENRGYTPRLGDFRVLGNTLDLYNSPWIQVLPP